MRSGVPRPEQSRVRIHLHSPDRTLKQLVSIYSTATNLYLKASEVLRSVLVVLDHAMRKLERVVGQRGTLKRPKQ